MDLFHTYDRLTALDEVEQIGFAYYQKTGQYLRYTALMYLESRGDTADFAALETDEAKAFEAQVLGRLHTGLADVLPEQQFIPEGTNAELQHLPRYLDIAPHRHDFFELVCVLRGRCLHKVEHAAVTMQPGDVTIIAPNVRHYLRAEPDCMALTIKIRTSTFDNAFSVLMRSGTLLSAFFAKTLYARHYRSTLTFHCGADAYLPELLLYMFHQQLEKKRHYNYVIEGLLSAFFPYLVQNFEDRIELSAGDNARDGRMIAVENHLRQHYADATLQSTAETLYLSPAYLSTLIKRQTGLTFSSILRRIKMEQAAALLKSTDMRVEQVCEHVGYADPTQFIRTFKTFYGTTPLRYKKEAQQGLRPAATPRQ